MKTVATITRESCKMDEQFLSGLEIKDFNISIYLFYQGTDKVKYIAFKGDKIMFEGNDYRPSPLYSGIDTLESCVDLLGFLTVQPRDTDKEYFKDYTPEQMEWCKSFECEQLNGIVNDFDSSDKQYQRAAKRFFKKAYVQ
jgi:hypothetical protein